MKNLLIVIGFWITVGSNFFSHAVEGETAPFGGSIRESLGENTPAGCLFGTQEGKSNRQGRKPMKFRSNQLEGVEFQRTQNPKLHPLIPIWDLASRLEMELEIPLLGEKESG
ncbi:hypothetical protein AVEN_1261-1 [Araneus ventricosus]|uniref:Uncharacterized protein n=1 Tax=Araneus ventricosus TaxID=182803 RepID=A0A4Y2TAS1_ARAVE|nr:hypothetical protein AVEN_1261-1 [Araneus ventricosus]